MHVYACPLLFLRRYGVWQLQHVVQNSVGIYVVTVDGVHSFLLRNLYSAYPTARVCVQRLYGTLHGLGRCNVKL